MEKTNFSISKKLALGIIFPLLLGLFSSYGFAASEDSATALLGPATKKVTWGTAIKKACKEYAWVKNKTFSKCTKLARKKGILASPLPKKLTSKKRALRKHLVLLVDRSNALRLAASSQSATTIPAVKSTALPAPQEMPATTQTQSTENLPKEIPPKRSYGGLPSPFNEETVAADFFENIKLSSPLLNRFYVDEVYFLEGDLAGTSAEEVFAFVCKNNEGCSDAENFISKTSAGHFKISLQFKKPGNFQMGIIPGRSGQSRIQNISVVPDDPPASGGSASTALSVNYEAGKTTFSWNGSGTPTRLIIFQDDKRVDYFFRQDVSSFAPDSIDFTEFQKGRAHWLVVRGSVASEIQNMDLTTQEFYKVQADEAEIRSLQEVFRVPSTFTFRGKAVKTISKRAAMTRPNGFVEEVIFADKDIPAGESFSFPVELTSTGTYIFEINNPEGSASINVPIYVGSSIPLLPDFFALNPAKLEASTITDIASARQTMLALINADRRAHGLRTVEMVANLNAIAQSHSDNMVQFNFFGHKDKQGRLPDDRRQSASIATPIRENLGKATSLELVESGLMRSPVHRDALLDAKMKRIGIGITKDAQGYFYVTQNFSADPLNQEDLRILTQELLTNGNDSRSRNGLGLLTSNTTLEDVAREWSTRMASENFFGVTDKSGGTLINAIRARGVTQSIQVHIIESSDKDILTDELLKQEAMKNAENRQVGIGLAVGPLGEVFMTVIYTP